MIQLNISEKDLQNEEKVKEIAISIFRMKRLAFGTTESYDDKLDKCFGYYNGTMPVTVFEKYNGYNSRVVNFAKPICDTATQTFIGDMPNITTSDKRVAEKNRISLFTQKLNNADFGTHICETAHYSSKCGTGFLALYNELGDKFPRFRELNPRFADSVYDCTLAKRHIMSYYMCEVDEPTNGGTALKSYVLYIYTKKKIYAFKTNSRMIGNASVPDTTKDAIMPFSAWTLVKANGEEEKVASVEHNFNDIPIVEFPNNAEFLGDAEPVFDLIAFYNDLFNNRGKNVHDIVNYVLYIKNATIGNEDDRKAFIEMLEQNKVLALEGDNVDAKFLSNPLNQEQLQMLQNNVKDNIHYISRVPDLSSVDFSQNASDPIIKIKTKPLLDLCKQKEKFFSKPLIRVIRMVLEWCKNNDADYKNYSFDLSKVSLKYTHTLPSNDSDMITMITNLQNSRMANPEVLLENLSFIPSVHDYIVGMQEWNESVDKAKRENQNIIKDNGVNQNNIDKQKPLSKDQMDNKRNFNLGLADRQSDNKE